ncbi:DUF421 domain-containing protein [Brevibacillus dissolubilis]|uniref:DUF421 domain-containing protein n=1 Tax=Brevibacillus dissolubilis TaxID=1844116 RepID=UPI001117418A|nr:DUF421 domain-containing protein [Brevibacillus dissolubilis]
MEYVHILGRTILAFTIPVIMAKILGKQTTSNMTFHDFVVGITVGGIAANLAFNKKIPTMYFIVAFAVFMVISYVISVVALKSHKSRSWVSGEPTVLIEGGKILETNMKKVKFTMDSLNQSLRQKDIFNIEEVEYAVLENNGQLSVKKKDEYLTVTKKDLQLPFAPHSHFPVELIIEGKITKQALETPGISKEWLITQVTAKGRQLSDVFYAVKTTNGHLVFDFYQDDLQKPVDQE